MPRTETRVLMAVRHAGVLGKPVAHSLSPVIHNAGYAAAGLTDWRYTAHECDEAALPGRLSGLGPEWAGLSLTMPLKEVALAVAGSVSGLAAALGAANTLVARADGWYADNTDAPGMVDALREAGVGDGPRVAILGAGGTARAALYAARELAAHRITAYARRAGALADLAAVAARLDLTVHCAAWDSTAEVGDADVVISTVPRGVADHLAAILAVPGAPDGATFFDVVYDPWPTPLAAAAMAGGRRVVSGLDLLLAQATRQFTLFTGRDAPAAAMRDALLAAAGRRVADSGSRDRTPIR